MEIHTAASSKGAVSFPYRGYTISVSNTLSKTVIFDKEGACFIEGGHIVTFSADINGIVAAKEFIDARDVAESKRAFTKQYGY